MAKSKEPVNPFYVLLVVIGIAFVITACGYSVMAWRATQPQPGPRAGAPAARAHGGEKHPLMVFLDGHGLDVLTWELIGLGGATFGAMWLDRFRSQRRERHAGEEDTRSEAEWERRIR